MGTVVPLKVNQAAAPSRFASIVLGVTHFFSTIGNNRSGTFFWQVI
jgi:hypothetical protein